MKTILLTVLLFTSSLLYAQYAITHSGGLDSKGEQTGADQAGLDVAIKLGIPHGGAIPKGRLTEDGFLPEKYQLEKMTTKSYPKHTEKNVVDSDGTVIITHRKLTGGSLLTQEKEPTEVPGARELLETMTMYQWLEALEQEVDGR